MSDLPPPPPPSNPPAPAASPLGAAPPSRAALILVAWLWVILPLAYGVYELVRKAAQLFTG